MERLCNGYVTIITVMERLWNDYNGYGKYGKISNGEHHSIPFNFLWYGNGMVPCPGLGRTN